MKHLREYVDWDSQETGADDSWKLGSYVLIDIKDFTESNRRYLDIPPKSDSIYGHITKWRNDEEFPFEITLSNNKTIEVTIEEIKRYLTEEEIEKYKMDLESNKYNL